MSKLKGAHYVIPSGVTEGNGVEGSIMARLSNIRVNPCPKNQSVLSTDPCTSVYYADFKARFNAA